MADTSVFVKTRTRAQAEAWVTVFRTLGMKVLARPTNAISVSHDGRWVVRAESSEPAVDQRLGQRQDGLTCTLPNEAS